MPDPNTVRTEAIREYNWHMWNALCAEIDADVERAEVHAAHAKREGLIVETMDEVIAHRRGIL